MATDDEEDDLEYDPRFAFRGKWWSYDTAQRNAKKRERLENEAVAYSEHRERHKTFRSVTAVERFELNLLPSYTEIVRPAVADPVAVDVISRLSAGLLKELKRHPDAIHRLAPRQFEELVAELLASFGWRVELTRATKDGGYDIFGIHRDVSGLESAWLVECKKFRPDRPVGVELVRSFWAVKTDLNVPNGLIATTSHFTTGAKQFKTSRWDLSFRDLEAVLEWVNAYKPNPDGSLYLRHDRLLVRPRKR